MDETPVPPLPATPQRYSAIAGITRTMNEPQPSQAVSIRASVRNQALSWVLFVVALLPPIALVLAEGLSGAARQIPYAAMWSWGAVLLGVVLAFRGGLAAATSERANAITELAGPLILLLVAIVVLLLRLRVYPVSLPLAIAQVVVYTVYAFALLLAPSNLTSEV